MSSPLSATGSVNDGNAGGDYSYTFVNDTSGVITPKTLTITGLSANNKTYDATITATLSGTPALSGVISGDTVTLGGTGSATFNTRHVGTTRAFSCNTWNSRDMEGMAKIGLKRL